MTYQQSQSTTKPILSELSGIYREIWDEHNTLGKFTVMIPKILLITGAILAATVLAPLLILSHRLEHRFNGLFLKKKI